MLWFSHSLAAIKNLVSKHDVHLVSLLVGIFVVRFGCDPLYANLWNECISISLIERKLNFKSTYSRTLACIKRILYFILSFIICTVTLCSCAKTNSVHIEKTKAVCLENIFGTLLTKQCKSLNELLLSDSSGSVRFSYQYTTVDDKHEMSVLAIFATSWILIARQEYWRGSFKNKLVSLLNLSVW